MSDLPATRSYERACKQRVAEATPRAYGATRIEVAAGDMHDELLARIAELEAKSVQTISEELIDTAEVALDLLEWAEAASAELRSKNLQLNHDLAKFPPRREHIAELEAELATVNSLLDMKREREQHWSDEAWRYRHMNEQLQAERKAP